MRCALGRLAFRHRLIARLLGVVAACHPAIVLGQADPGAAPSAAGTGILPRQDQPADTGEIFIDGKPVHIEGPRQAEELGIGMIYQEFNLVPALNAIDNIVLGG